MKITSFQKLALAVGTALLFLLPNSALAARTDSLWDYPLGGNYYKTNGSPSGVDILIYGSNHYLNWGSLSGSTGYGLRDNAGTIEFKNQGGAWAGIGSGGGGGSAYPFTPLTNYATTMSATTSPLWAQAGIYASSTTAFPTLAIQQSGAGPAATFMGGTVGIGTANPTNTLEVGGGGASPAAILRLNDSNDAQQVIFANGSTNRFRIRQNGAGLKFESLSSSLGRFFNFTGGTLVNGDNGNNSLLSLGGTFNDVSNKYNGLIVDVTNTASAVNSAIADFRVGGLSKLFVDVSGNVGLGTTTPGSILSIQGVENVTTATTTRYATGGINLTGGGCFAISGVCVGGAGTTYTAGTGLTLTTGAFSVNTSQNIATLSNLTGNGAILTSGSVGTLGTYAGTSCTNQFVRSLSSAIAATCATVANTDLANSTISGVALGGSLFALTHDATLLGISYNGSAAVSNLGLDLTHANAWTGLQQFTNASSSLSSHTGTAYFGATATSTINADGKGSIVVPSTGSITASGLGTAAGTFVAADSTGKLIATTTPAGPSHANGFTSRLFTSSSGTEVITHNLGHVPKFIQMVASGQGISAADSLYDSGSYNGSTYSNAGIQMHEGGSSAVSDTAYSDATNLLTTYADSGLAGSLAATISAMDSTTFTISWTKGGTPGSGGINVAWNAE